MDEKDYELLRILKKTRNITRTAEEMYITQSALSKRIRKIEEELGLDLLIRSHTGIVFTPEGETVAEYCMKAEKEMDTMRNMLDSLSGEVSGTLRAGLSMNYAIFVLPQLLISFCKKYPQVNVVVTSKQSRELYGELVSGNLDLGILRGEFTWDGPKYALAEERLCVICCEQFKDHPLDEQMYIERESDVMQVAMIHRWLREQGIPRPVSRLHTDSIISCVQMAEKGLGWAIVPEIALKDFRGVKVPCVFDNGEPLVRRSWLLCRSEVVHLPQIQAFIEEVLHFAQTNL